MPNEALLVMDMQNGIVERFGDHAQGLLDHVSAALDAARSVAMTILFVRVAFREGVPEVSARNKSFAALTQSPGMEESASATQIHSRLGPRAGEPVVTKRRVSAFSGSDLDVLLRARDINSLVLCGIATSGVVLSTIRQAADLDYSLTVLSDACLDADPEVHEVLMGKVFVRQATVCTVREWASRLSSAT